MCTTYVGAIWLSNTGSKHIAVELAFTLGTTILKFETIYNYVWNIHLNHYSLKYLQLRVPLLLVKYTEYLGQIAMMP